MHSMWMVTFIGIPSSCMLRYILYVASFVRSSGCFLFSLPSVSIALMASTASRLLFLVCEFAAECRNVQTCVQCPLKSTKLHVTPICRKRTQQT